MFSDYIIYVDESGDHSLTTVDPNYPVFVVAFCIIKKADYPAIVTDLLKLKFKTWGHDMVVFHEREIRKRLHDFAFLNNPPRGRSVPGGRERPRTGRAVYSHRGRDPQDEA